MATDEGSSFWMTLPGMLTAIAALVTAGTGLLIALSQVGLLGDDSSSGGAGDSSATAPSPAGQAPSEGGEDNRVDGALVGSWRGVASSPEEKAPFRVDLQITGSCRLDEECGTIHVSSQPCTGRVTLVGIEARVYEFYVDDFMADSSSSGCDAGAGDFFELLDDDTLKYTTDYNDAVGLLDKRS